MKIGVQIFVTARKAITIESSEHGTKEDCLAELEGAAARLRLDQVKADLIDLFGDD